VPTLRNVDRRPSSDFVKAYGHNGYFKSLKAIVHFYNTRDALPRCQPNDPGEGTTCWPAPEPTANMNTKRVGRLGLSEAEEDAIVSFLQTMTDGFMPVNHHGAGTQVKYRFNPTWATYGLIEYDKRVGATAASPIVTGPGGSTSQWTFGVGFTYSFAMSGLPF
jgi:hypothetical protein